MVDFPRGGLVVIALLGCGRVGFDPAVVDVDVTAPCTGLICDRFDAPTIDPLWMLDIANGTVTVDPTRAHRGTSSLHVQTQAVTSSVTDPRATLLGYQGLGAPTQVQGDITGTIYTRVWMYFASPQPTTPFLDQVINFADQPGNGISVGAKNGFLVDNDYTALVYMQSPTAKLPLDRWTCLQMEMPSGTTATVRFLVDGVDQTDVAIAKTMIQQRPTHVYIGIEWVGTTSNLAAADAWVDDIIVDSSPHTCAE